MWWRLVESWSDPKVDSFMEKLNKSQRDREAQERLNNMERGSQGFSISKIDNQTLNQLDTFGTIKQGLWSDGMKTVSFVSDWDYTITLENKNTGFSMSNISDFEFPNDTKNLKLSSQSKEPYGDVTFSFTDSKWELLSFTLHNQKNPHKHNEKVGSMHEQQNDKFTLNNISEGTQKHLSNFADIQSTSKWMILHLKPNTILEYSVDGGKIIMVKPGDLNQAMIPNSTTIFEHTSTERRIGWWDNFESSDKNGSITQIKIRYNFN